KITLTGTRKKKLCEKKYNNPNLKDVELAKKYGITKCQRKPNYPDLKKAMSIWVKQTIKNAQYRHILCQNHFEAYNTITKDNPVSPNITLYNAINFAAQAWKNIIADTIIHSWGKASILPSIISMLEEIRLDVPLPEETELNMFMPRETELEKEIIDLI
ncbi:8265_t:CDS:2, partial [Cetraspora pellucida]